MKEKVKEWTTFWLFLISYIAFLSLIVVDLLKFQIVEVHYSVRIIFVAVMFMGLFVRRSTVNQLGEFFDVNVRIKKNHQIIQNGFYKYLRHPMYSANILIFFGIAGIFSSVLGILAILVLILPATIIRIYKEEYFLREKFGVSYDKYVKKTKRLVPFVW